MAHLLLPLILDYREKKTVLCCFLFSSNVYISNFQQMLPRLSYKSFLALSQFKFLYKMSKVEKFCNPPP